MKELLQNLNITLLLTITVGTIFLLWFISVRNKFVTLRNEAKVSYADIFNTLKKKYDTLESLINVIKKQTEFEKDVQTSIATLRSGFSVNEKSLNAVERKIYAVKEQYPSLGSNVEFERLAIHVADLDNEINGRKDHYNTCANFYNTTISTFPNNIVAKLCGYTPISMYKYSKEELDTMTQRVVVKF